MDQPEEELEQMTTWFTEEGLAPDSSKEAQLCFLWRALQCTRSRLSGVTWDLDTQRSQHLAEMTEVRKSLEQIRIFTEHKDVLAQEIQDENDQLKDQLRRLISLQDSQISEVAKMLYQQGLTELIHSSPSEQVAYLLVERASLLETSEIPDNPTGDGNTASLLGTEAQVLNASAHQSSHKGAPRHGQSPWKRLFGLHKASQNKHTFIPAETQHLADQASSVGRECSRLERDLEEGSRRLAMAHNEIRRLTDELESAHLTQRAYEPELQAAQLEVEQLRQEVEKLKKYEMAELRKAKEMNDRLDLEIRALRNRVRCLDAEKSSLQQTMVSLREKVERLESAKQAEQRLLTVQVQATQVNELAKSQATELSQSNQTCRNLQEELSAQMRCLLEKEETVVSLQREVERLESALHEQQQQHAEQQLLTLQVQANQAKSKAADLIRSNDICRDLQNKLSSQTRRLLEKDSEIHSLKQQLDNSHKDLHKPIATICTKENQLQDQKLWEQKEADSQYCEDSHCQLKDSFASEDKEQQTQQQLLQNKECPDYQEAVNTLLATQDQCETLKKEVCETLQCLDRERSKYHEMKEKHKLKLCRAKQKFDDETAWRDEKINNLERELSLCSHSLAKEKDLTISITVENDKLLVERRRLLQQLNEEEHNKKDSNLTATLSKCRVDFLELENKKLGNKILHMSNQLAVLERSLQNMQSLHFAEVPCTDLKKKSNPMQVFTSLPVPTSSETMPEPSEIQGESDSTQSKQTDVTSSPHCFSSGSLSRSAEMGYLNLTSAQSRSDYSAHPATLSRSSADTMDGVLEGAAVLCVCKLACSLLFLPSLAASHSPVSFCCCCLLIFTDFLVAVFLSFLCIFESWLTELTQLGDVIALRFLLFLSHTYGVVLLLTTPLIAVETLSRLLWPHSAVAYRAVSQRVTGSNAQRCYVRMETVEEEEADGDNPDKDVKKSLSYVVSYLCCLSVWVVVALNVRWRWKLEEVWAAVCLHKTNSLIRCLPNLFSPMSSTVNPCWVMAFLSLLLILLTMSMGLQRRQRAGAQMVRTQREKHGVNNDGISYRRDLVPALTAPTKTANPGTSVSECVDPEKTESSCTVHRACSWNSAQMLACHHGDFVLISPECLSAGQEPKTGIPVTFSTEDHVDSQYRSQCGWLQRGFPCLEVNVMIEFVGVLSIFVLPLNLSVNILLIRTIETLLEQCIKSLVTSAANANSTYTPHKETPA